MESLELELQHLINGCGGRLGLLVLRKLFRGGYESVKRQWFAVGCSECFELFGEMDW